MAGMKDEAGRAAQQRCLSDDHLAELQSIVDAGMSALRQTEWKSDDSLAIDRNARAVGSMVRMIKLVDGLRRKPAKSEARDNRARTSEDSMSEDEAGHGDDMDPAEFARVRADLECRLNRLRANIETKREARRHLLRAGTAGGGGEYPRPSCSPASA
jgi:hypothetical protein